jgi:hypothetical protein
VLVDEDGLRRFLNTNGNGFLYCCGGKLRLGIVAFVWATVRQIRGCGICGAGTLLPADGIRLNLCFINCNVCTARVRGELAIRHTLSSFSPVATNLVVSSIPCCVRPSVRYSPLVTTGCQRLRQGCYLSSLGAPHPPEPERDSYPRSKSQTLSDSRAIDARAGMGH